MKMKMSRFFEFLTIVSMLCACSDVGKTAGTDEQSEGVFAVKDREIAGVTQKGPFLVGSSVTIQELNRVTLVQTGRSFKTSVKSDQGDFVLRGVSLVSPYALLEVNGYYFNEVSWEKSEGMVTLNALTDLTDRNHVNVNVLTHLMVDRVLRLVQKEGKSFTEAKKQAEEEALALFGIEGGLEKSEDMDLFAGEGREFLAALSVMMQRNGAMADLSERLALAALSFEKNEGFGAEMVDWTFETEYDYFEKGLYHESGELGFEKNILYKVSRNMESWIQGWNSEKFVNYMYDFWAQNFGLGKCDEKNDEEIRKNINEQSKYYGVVFRCDGDNKRWIWGGYRKKSDSTNVEIIDLRDGTIYKTLRIGNVTWMAENLRYGKSRQNIRKNGNLYRRDSALSACPKGFRLPRYSEAENLLQQYGGAGKNAADSLLAKNGFNAILGDDGTLALWISTKGLYFEDSTSSYYSQNGFVLWIDSSIADIREFDFYSDRSRALVRCVIDSVQVSDEPKQYSADKYIIDARDNEKYRFTEINGKYWMAENLRYKAAVTKDSICGHDECYYICGDEGCFYSWYEAVGSDSTHDVCPESWHLPSQFEWNEMLTFVADRIDSSWGRWDPLWKYYDIGYRLGSFRDWNKDDFVLQEVDNLYDFSVKPVGLIRSDLYYDEVRTEFWTSSDTLIVDAGYADADEGGLLISLEERSMSMKASLLAENKLNRCPVRCVKD
ncbi:FISUMP domain-containing protein [Fibrobacter succinogenes]|uniref:FISUMP domain-containing protein n=1 Tax=Fibrobacter succinogenes TaxID=833 RepID=UPI0015685347|nr:FISUMP domain-containing protein [Fibrobacter succinogenes]